MKNLFVQQKKKEFLDIFNRIRKKDFNGYTGVVIKNSMYSFATTIIEKIGALVFIIVLARILMPELFGLYSLALSTILLFVTFSDLGIGQTLVRFVSQALDKNKQSKAKEYIIYLAKIKTICLLIVVFVLAISTRFIAHNYYNKPISLALIAGILYILLIGIISFIQLFFQSINDFKILLFKQIFFQILRIILVPVVVLYSLKQTASAEINILVVVLSLSLVWALTLLFLLFFANKLSFLRAKTKRLPDKEKKKLNKFILGLSVFTFSGLFFGYIDIVILGGFVLSNFIGYYQAAFTLVGAFASLIFFYTALFPIFSRIKGRRLERGLKKATWVTFVLSLIMLIGILIFAPLMINIIYGPEYFNSIFLLRLLSPLLICLPLIFLYTTYFISRGEIKTVTRILSVSLIINIFLNYLFIMWFINHSHFAAVIGVCVATLISKYFYLFCLIISRKRLINKKSFNNSPINLYIK